MSLIKCPECGKDVSERAKTCPHCGYPIAEYITCNLNSNGETEEDKEISDEEIKALETILLSVPNNKTITIKERLSELLGISPERSHKIVEYYFANANYNVCPKCGTRNEKEIMFCKNCSYRIIPPYKFKGTVTPFGIFENNNEVKREFETIDKKEEQKFNGIYRYTLLGGKKEVYCPRCGSEDCSHIQQQRTIPGKTKTKYTANLNPLKPFTLLNKKEKVIRKEEIVTESKIICNKCGYIF